MIAFLKKYKIIQPNFETLKLSWVYYASLIGYSILIATNTNYLNFFDEFNMANYFKDNIWHGIEPHQFKLVTTGKIGDDDAAVGQLQRRTHQCGE